MPKFAVYAYTTIDLFAKVEAANAEEAKEVFRELDLPSLCHQCDGSRSRGDGEVSFNGRPEGEATIVDVEES